jgi:hypothetical protein
VRIHLFSSFRVLMSSGCLHSQDAHGALRVLWLGQHHIYWRLNSHLALMHTLLGAWRLHRPTTTEVLAWLQR